MSWLFSQVLVEEYLGENFLDGEQSVPLNGSHTQQAYCVPDKMTAFSKLSQSGMTFKPLTATHGEALLTLYLAAFHVKTSQQLGGGGNYWCKKFNVETYGQDHSRGGTKIRVRGKQPNAR